MIGVFFFWTQASSHVPAHRGVWKPLGVSRVLECAQNVFSFLFFLHRHNDVTPSWFRALESHVLRVPNGNGMKKWSSPSSLSSPSVLVWFLAASRKQHSCLHLFCATTTSIQETGVVLCSKTKTQHVLRKQKVDQLSKADHVPTNTHTHTLLTMSLNCTFLKTVKL